MVSIQGGCFTVVELTLWVVHKWSPCKERWFSGEMVLTAGPLYLVQKLTFASIHSLIESTFYHSILNLCCGLVFEQRCITEIPWALVKSTYVGTYDVKTFNEQLEHSICYLSKVFNLRTEFFLDEVYPYYSN